MVRTDLEQRARDVTERAGTYLHLKEHDLRPDKLANRVWQPVPLPPSHSLKFLFFLGKRQTKKLTPKQYVCKKKRKCM